MTSKGRTGINFFLQRSVSIRDAAPPFSSAPAAAKALNEACRGCHDDELRAANDSHARSLFRSPRMAVYLERLDVRQARPSHAGLAFDSCASAGCHNYHDNRALYEEFLVRHAGRPWVAPAPVHGLSARARAPRQPQGTALAPGADLAARNFQGKPGIHIESVDWATRP